MKGKSMELFKKRKNKDQEADIEINAAGENINSEEEKPFDPNCLEVVLERIDKGLIGSLRIEDDINSPIIKKGDICHLRAPKRVLKTDFVFYKAHNDYFLRRIIKYKDDGIYVAGDHERLYHIIKKEDIIAKAVGRERSDRYLSLTLHQCNPFYTFLKVRLRFLRIKGVADNEEEMNSESLETAISNLEAKDSTELKGEMVEARGVVVDLTGFKDPDDLAKEFYKTLNADLALEDAEGEADTEAEESKSNADILENDDLEIEADDTFNTTEGEANEKLAKPETKSNENNE